jgi:hypothetical protein
MQTQVITDILSEDFSLPDCNIDLQDLIESCVLYYESMPLQRSITRNYKNKVNELIAEYNERRGMKIYNHIK